MLSVTTALDICSIVCTTVQTFVRWQFSVDSVFFNAEFDGVGPFDLCVHWLLKSEEGAI